jgi:dolichol-phosphate mannosyltransferase
MLLSVVIPAHNEADDISTTVRSLHRVLADAAVEHEIVVVDDHSGDGTGDVVRGLEAEIAEVRLVTNTAAGGFGMAVRAGLEAFRGDAVAIYMADASDSPLDLVMFVRAMEVHGVDCVFGTRFSAGGRTYDYPRLKLYLNRFANTCVRALFGMRYDDVTNAFKLYRREVIDGVGPLLSNHFNLTVELPLKAIVRGYSYTVVPNSWTNRTNGTSKFQIQEMGSRYAFIVLYCFLERWLSRGDYHRRQTGPAAERQGRQGGG